MSFQGFNWKLISVSLNIPLVTVNATAVCWGRIPLWNPFILEKKKKKNTLQLSSSLLWNTDNSVQCWVRRGGGGFCFGSQFHSAAVITVVSPFVLGSIFKYWGFMGIDVFNLIPADMWEFRIAFRRDGGEAAMRRHILWILFECQTEKTTNTAQETTARERESGVGGVGEAGATHWERGASETTTQRQREKDWAD